MPNNGQRKRFREFKVFPGLLISVEGKEAKRNIMASLPDSMDAKSTPQIYLLACGENRRSHLT